MSGADNAIRAQNLRLRAGERTLLDRFDWQARAGECWCVIGRNGAGKSTLLRTLAGLQEPDAGSVEISGRPLAEWRPAALAKERAFLPQIRNDAFGYRAIETVLAARHPYHADRYWESDDDIRIASDALREMDALDLAERDVRTLSGGERQRVAIAALLAQDAHILLLDEPANALDLAHQADAMRVLASLCRERGKTAVMVVHDLNLAHGVADHALLMNGDGTWLAGAVEETMRVDTLSAVLGHPIDIVRHGARSVFIPAGKTT